MNGNNIPSNMDELLTIITTLHAIVLDDKAWEAVAPHIFKPGANTDDLRQAIHHAIDRQGAFLTTFLRAMDITQGLGGMLGGMPMPGSPLAGADDDDMPNVRKLPPRKPPEAEGPDSLFGT